MCHLYGQHPRLEAAALPPHARAARLAQGALGRDQIITFIRNEDSSKAAAEARCPHLGLVSVAVGAADAAPGAARALLVTHRHLLQELPRLPGAVPPCPVLVIL